MALTWLLLSETHFDRCFKKDMQALYFRMKFAEMGKREDNGFWAEVCPVGPGRHSRPRQAAFAKNNFMFLSRLVLFSKS